MKGEDGSIKVTGWGGDSPKVTEGDRIFSSLKVFKYHQISMWGWEGLSWAAEYNILYFFLNHLFKNDWRDRGTVFLEKNNN